MAVAKQVVKAKKNWHPIMAPKMFNEYVLGESIVSDVGKLNGRCVAVNLMTLTNDAKHQSVNVFFRIAKTEQNNAFTEIIGYETSPSAVRRLIRRDISRLDDSFVVETVDKKQARVKPMLLTKTKTTSAVLKALRNSMTGLIAKDASNNDFDSFIRNIISHKLQVAVKDSLKKVYPIRSVEIKKVELLAKPAAKIVKVQQEEQKELKKPRKKESQEEKLQEEE